MRFQFKLFRIANACMSLYFVLGSMFEPLYADDHSSSKLAAPDMSQQKPIEFEARIREISPAAIRFHGSFVLPTNAATLYFQLTQDGEMQVRRSELDQLIEELDQDPYQPPHISGGDINFTIRSFKLGGRVRCEYIPGQSATKIVIQPVTNEERRTRPMFMSISHELDTSPAEQPQDGFNRRVSLKARAMPLKDAITELARSAQLPLVLDESALIEAKIDLNSPITMEVVDEPLQHALLRLIDWNSVEGVYGDFRGGRWHVTTIEASTERLNSILPEWLKPGKTPGLHPQLGDDGQVKSMLVQTASNEILARLKTLPKLRELDIQGMNGVTPDAFAAFAELDSVEQLSFRANFDSESTAADDIAEQIGKMKSLRVLTVSETGITDEGMRELSGLPLIELTLYQEGRLTDQAITEVAKMKHLKRLQLTTYVSNEKLGSMRFTSRGLGQLSALKDLERLSLAGQPAPKQLPEFPKLTTLRLEGPIASDMGRIEVLNDDGAADIAKAIHLKYLLILRHQISSQGWRNIGMLPELRGICLPGDINDSEIENLTKHGLPKLTQVRLTANSATDEGLGYLTEFKTLNRLDLSGPNITAKGLQQLKSFPNLRSLHLYGLAAASNPDNLKQLTQLKELWLERVNIKQNDYNNLEVALPETRIYAGSGTRWLWSIHDQK